MRQARDGTLYVPHAGKPPAPPMGYERSAWSEYVFVPILKFCVFKRIKPVQYACCREPRMETHCELLSETKTPKITMGDCKACQDSDFQTTLKKCG